MRKTSVFVLPGIVIAATSPSRFKAPIKDTFPPLVPGILPTALSPLTALANKRDIDKFNPASSTNIRFLTSILSNQRR
nr:hypothetical protein [Nostoc sp. WHI]